MKENEKRIMYAGVQWNVNSKRNEYFIQGSFECIEYIAGILEERKYSMGYDQNFNVISENDKWKIIFKGYASVLSMIVVLCEEIRELKDELKKSADIFYEKLLAYNIAEQEIKYLVKAIVYLKKAQFQFCTKEQKRTALASYRRNAEKLRILARNNPEFIEKKRSDIYDEL